MAQTRLADVITQFRSFYGDEYLIGTVSEITSPLTQDGETITAAKAKSLVQNSANQILMTAYSVISSSRKNVSEIGQAMMDMFPECTIPVSVAGSVVTNPGIEWEFPLPDDFGWVGSARFRGENAAGDWVENTPVLFGGPAVYENAVGEDVWERQVVGRVVRGAVRVARNAKEVTPATGVDKCELFLTYISLQPPFGTGDLLLDPKWDYQLLRLMKVLADTYREGRDQ